VARGAGAASGAAVSLVLHAAKAGDEAALLRKRNVDMQAALRARGLATHGGKKVLVKRLVGSYTTPAGRIVKGNS